MEMKTINSTKTELEIQITDENETILHPLTTILSDNKDVEYAACMADHPMENKRRLFIRMKKGSPKDALQQAVKTLNSEIKTFTKQVDSASKGKK